MNIYLTYHTNERMKYMPHSKPRKSLELQILAFLNARMDLSSRDKKNLHNLERGYEGERKFSHLLGNGVSSECIKDRKSTRLNSSHVATSYAVFCLKKKKN